MELIRHVRNIVLYPGKATSWAYPPEPPSRRWVFGLSQNEKGCGGSFQIVR